MKILTPLRVDYIDGRRWRLAKTFVVDFEGEFGLHRLFIPQGFVTDFNSVPRIFWRIAPPTEFGEAAVVHDYLYRSDSRPVVAREVADNAHRALMKAKGASWVRHASYFRALRLFGGSVFHVKKVDGSSVD